MIIIIDLNFVFLKGYSLCLALSLLYKREVLFESPEEGKYSSVVTTYLHPASQGERRSCEEIFK